MIVGRVCLSARWLLAGLLGAALTIAYWTGPVAAQESDDNTETAEESADNPGSATDRVIQILDVVEDEDGTVTIDVAIPGVIGELEPPIEENFGVAVRRTLLDVDQAVKVETPVDVIVVIDTSFSMNGEPLRDAKLAATTFVEQLPPQARVGVIGFGELVDVLSTPSLERDTTLSQINSLRAIGETALWDALVESATIGGSTGANGGQTYVVVLADGDNSVPGTTQDDAVTAITESGVDLYALAIKSDESNGEQLSQVAESVGGIFTTVESSAELEALYQEIAQRLASRYRLTFDARSTGGGSVVVSVAKAEGAVATARTFLEGVAQPTATAEPDGPARVLNVPEGATLGTVGVTSPGPLGAAGMLPVGAAAVFLALVLLGVLMINPAMEVRLDAASGADRIAGVNQRLSGIADRIVARRDEEGELDQALDAAGLHLRPGEFLLLSLIVVILATVAGWFAGGALSALILAGIAIVGMLGYLNRRARTRRNLFADQLTDTLSIMIGALRAGRGLPQAIELVATESLPPTAEQFRRVTFETQVGRDMTESMMSVAQRMKSQDFEWVARAVEINRELGGDLTEVLGNVAGTIRDRRRIGRMVQALSAEGRASGWVMIILPFIMFAFMAWRTPENTALMTGTSLGRFMLALAALGMIIGYLWIRKLVDMEY